MATRIQPRRHELLEKSSSPGRLDLLEFWQPTQAAVCASYSDRLELLGFGNKTQAAVSASYSDDKLDLLRFGNKYLLVLFVTLSIAHGAVAYIGTCTAPSQKASPCIQALATTFK
jgi:hypothetical protein